MYAEARKQYCDKKDRYGTFKTLDEAKFACTSDERCADVFDSLCMEESWTPYTLCPWNSTKSLNVEACSYKKPGKYGIGINTC